MVHRAPEPERPAAMQRLDADRPSLTERTVEVLRTAVRSGRLVPGELYSVHQVADELGVSRSPVREALLRLAGTGLVAFERNRGFRVVVPSAEDLLEIFALRLDLEVPAAGRAAASRSPGLAAALTAELAAMRSAAVAQDERAFMSHDQRLHAAVLAATGNRRVVRLVEDLRDATRLVGASTVGTSRTLEHVYAEHEPIVAAIAAGRVEAARAAMAEHVGRTAELLLTQAAGPDTDPVRRWLALR